MSIVARSACKRDILDHVGRSMSWREVSSLPRLHELRLMDGEVIGTLRWDEALGSFAVAECSKGTWMFRRRGLVKARVIVREQGSESDVAVLRTNWKGGGTLQVSGERRYHWSNVSLWASSWAFSTDSGELLLGISTKQALVRLHAEVSVEPGAASLQDLDLLVLLSGYLHTLIADDFAAVLAAP